MRFKVTHTTHYAYSAPASESVAELRVWPQSTDTQTVLKRELKITPATAVDSYIDYFGNMVEFFSIPYRHTELDVSAYAEVETLPGPELSANRDVTCAETLQIFNGQMFRLYEFLQPSTLVPLGDVLRPIRKRFFAPAQPIGEALLELNKWIFKQFTYTPGVTDISTPLKKVIAERKGVCQDYAHLMLAICRSYGLPSRYVSGYIEAYDPATTDPKLIGAAASHAWVEVCLPGGYWWGLDPTNNQIVGERHVKIAVGRDYHDVAPMRGAYKGAQDQKLDVIVELKRRAT